MRTAEEHLAWCKKRALEYLDAGELANAFTSMLSDMDKHPETKLNDTPTGTALTQLGMLYLEQGDPVALRRWIEGFR